MKRAASGRSKRYTPVATALTACGIETSSSGALGTENLHAVATALTACGIETLATPLLPEARTNKVATALTACGIETQTDGNVE